tara:strand:+ start:268 stop:927 length:660 start_codon:yes stop_codon:yes gene_type:complete
MLSPDQAKTMLELQATMNSKVDSNWLSSKYPYLRAVAIEGAEAIEHHGWKWWKKQVKDLAQLQMELIDIWHFFLSEILLRNGGDREKALKSLLNLSGNFERQQKLKFDEKEIDLNDCDLLSKLELLIATSISQRIEIKLFNLIMDDCQISWTELYTQYVGKNVLNIFRQEHGYKQGTYQKVWEGLEDNEHLVNILNDLDSKSSNFKNEVYDSLEALYPN